METTETAEKWTDQQVKYIQFLSANKTDVKGKKYTRGEFAKILGISERILYDWQNMPGFKEAVFEASLGRRVDYLPQLIDAQVVKGIKKQDTAAFLALMRQWALLKSDKVETKNETNGELKITFGDASH